MTMNRAIHHAVRRDLDRLEEALRLVEDGDRGRVAQLSRAWQNLHDQLVEHHETEDEVIWPALEGLGIDPVLLGEMESEHGAMREALEMLHDDMRRLAGSASVTDAIAAAETVATTREVVERHLTHEELELEPQILRHKESPQWQAVEKQLRSGSPVRGGRMFAWILDGASPEVVAYVRSVVPRPVLVLLSRVFGIGYQRSIAPVWRT
jgi:hemerythrin-like domain-containing protein